MFKRDFVALGENQTRNFVAQCKLCLYTIASLWVKIKPAIGHNFVAQLKNEDALRRPIWETLL